MTGIIVIPAVLLYLLLSIVVVYLAIRYARKSGRSAKRWGWGAALVMYLIPFWDWLPTVATHQYYCAKDAGFWVYKTVDQWKAENPGVMEILVANKGAPSKTVYSGNNYTTTFFLNPRFNWVVEKTGPFLVYRHQWKQELVDSKNGEVLARYVDFSTGENEKFPGEPPIKFWLQSKHCSSGERHRGLMSQFKENFRGTEK
jgi:hypothetical protein